MRHVKLSSTIWGVVLEFWLLYFHFLAHGSLWEVELKDLIPLVKLPKLWHYKIIIEKKKIPCEKLIWELKLLKVKLPTNLPLLVGFSNVSKNFLWLWILKGRLLETKLGKETFFFFFWEGRKGNLMLPCWNLLNSKSNYLIKRHVKHYFRG